MIGENWDEANMEAVKSAEEEGTFLVHPFGQVREVTLWSHYGILGLS